MKSINNTGTFIVSLVAPLAGAWIEMLKGIDLIKSFEVAPLAGAWIEILRKARKTNRRRVAPLAGAWIEIQYLDLKLFLPLSLPSRERGLKLANAINLNNDILSLPSRERGLKLIMVIILFCLIRRSPRGSVD